jgi:hypothetical protein
LDVGVAGEAAAGNLRAPTIGEKRAEMPDLLETVDQLIDARFLYPLVIVLLIGSVEVGAWLGRRRRRTTSDKSEEMTTLTASALGLLALLLAFSLSHALSRHEARRAVILEEANAIGSTANFASMLPRQAQQAVLGLLREYVAVRIGLGLAMLKDTAMAA